MGENRADKYNRKPKRFYQKVFFYFVGIVVIAILAGYSYYQNSIQIKAPEKDFGRKVIIQLQNGKKVYTYENLLVHEDGKMYYQGERNKIDLTGGKVVFKDWK